MDLTLSDQQRAALALHPGQPLTIADDHTQYVLVRADLYRRLEQLASGYSDVTVEELMAASARAFATDEDWDAPGMDEYDTPPHSP